MTLCKKKPPFNWVQALFTHAVFITTVVKISLIYFPAICIKKWKNSWDKNGTSAGLDIVNNVEAAHYAMFKRNSLRREKVIKLLLNKWKIKAQTYLDGIPLTTDVQGYCSVD